MRKRGSQKLALTPETSVPAALEFHQPATALLRAVAHCRCSRPSTRQWLPGRTCRGIHCKSSASSKRQRVTAVRYCRRSKGCVTVTRQIEPTVSIQLLLALGVEEKYIFFLVFGICKATLPKQTFAFPRTPALYHLSSTLEKIVDRSARMRAPGATGKFHPFVEIMTANTGSRSCTSKR